MTGLLLLLCVSPFIIITCIPFYCCYVYPLLLLLCVSPFIVVIPTAPRKTGLTPFTTRDNRIWIWIHAARNIQVRIWIHTTEGHCLNTMPHPSNPLPQLPIVCPPFPANPKARAPSPPLNPRRDASVWRGRATALVQALRALGWEVPMPKAGESYIAWQLRAGGG